MRGREGARMLPHAVKTCGQPERTALQRTSRMDLDIPSRERDGCTRGEINGTWKL